MFADLVGVLLFGFVFRVSRWWVDVVFLALMWFLYLVVLLLFVSVCGVGCAVLVRWLIVLWWWI